MEKIKSAAKGFTLLELLVVVLIIGILASIALPQYEMAVTKAKVTSILPIMRRWKDAMYEYKLQHGSYCREGVDGDCDEYPDGSDLGVNWPSDWKAGKNPCGDSVSCSNDYWAECLVNENGTGDVYCRKYTSENGDLRIQMYQLDDPFEKCRGKITCQAEGGSEGHKICKALGGRLISGDENDWGEYVIY